MKSRIIAIFGFVLIGVGRVLSDAEEPGAKKAPEFKEVYELLRSNLPGNDDAELNKAAVQGLLGQLQSRAAIVDGAKGADRAMGTEPDLTSEIFDGAYGYLRVGRVTAGINEQALKAFQQLSSSNRLRGLVVDLRFAEGQDYPAATALADIFFAGEKPLMDYGDGMKRSTAKTNALTLPLTVLVNRQTAGAAEAFVGVLQRADAGLVLGTNTAGHAMMGKEFTLSTGQRLWIATAMVKLGDGKVFPAGGLQPDIQVEVSPEDERAYFEDAYKLLRKPNLVANSPTNQTLISATNRLLRHRTTEAELVRLHRDGQLPDPDAPPPKTRESDTPSHLITDPALARAIDLLKGMAVVQQFR